MIADDIRDFAFPLGRAQVATAQAAHDARQPEIDRLKAIIGNMKCVLELCEEYFDNRADVVDGSYGIPGPNKEMALLVEVRAAIAKAEGAAP